MLKKHPLNRQMRRAKLHHNDAAQVLGVPRSTVSRWLSGYTRMPIDIQEKLEFLLRFRLFEQTKTIEEQAA